jgi:hypothetical protein
MITISSSYFLKCRCVYIAVSDTSAQPSEAIWFSGLTVRTFEEIESMRAPVRGALKIHALTKRLICG